MNHYLLGVCLYQISINFSDRVYEELLLERGLYPGVESLDTPDVVDAVDADGALQGLEIHGWRRPRRLRRVVWGFLVMIDKIRG